MKPKKPTKRQLEIMRRFKEGERIEELGLFLPVAYPYLYVEQAIRTVMLWEEKR